MKTIVIPNYGRVTNWKVAGRILYKYLCKWVSRDTIYRHQSGKAIIVAPDIDTAITKACGIRGYKPNLIQKI